MNEAVAITVLIVTLLFAVLRPRRLPEVAVAAPGAGILLLIGAVSPGQAWDQIRDLLPAVAFLGAILMLATLCDAQGLFAAAGNLMARICRDRPVRLLVIVFAIASLTTVSLSLDATVVLLTPVVFLTATQLGISPRSYLYACAHLANSASLLLPVSNLTNLLAMRTLDLSFLRFAALMALPWLVAIGVEYVVHRWAFAKDMHPVAESRPAKRAKAATGSSPRLALAVVAGTLLGFAAGSPLGIEPAWIAAAGALILGIVSLSSRTVRVSDLARAANLPFLLFVLSLGIIVAAVTGSGLGRSLSKIMPTGASFPALLGAALLAATLANLVNNLPAILVLAPIAAVAGGPALVLAVLIGVNVGPNLTYAGSLATLLWRRIIAAHDSPAPLGEFSLLGAISVPLALVGAVGALWLSVQLIGV